MKRAILILAAAFWFCGNLPAQDAATEERLKKLTGLIQDLQETKETQRKQLETLSKEIQTLREQVARPANNNYANADDVRELAKKLQEIDKKRIEDNERILKEIEKLGKTLKASSGGSTRPPRGGNEETPRNTGSGSGSKEKGFEYTVQQGDFLSTIVQAYNKEGVKVTTEQVLKANPGLVPEKMKPGMKIWIPAPEK